MKSLHDDMLYTANKYIEYVETYTKCHIADNHYKINFIVWKLLYSIQI